MTIHWEPATLTRSPWSRTTSRQVCRFRTAEAEVARLRAGAEKVIGDYTRTAEEHGAGGDRDMVEMCEVAVIAIRRDILGGAS